MLKILQARLQQYMNCELPDVQAGFRKGRGTRDQIAIIHWIIEKTWRTVSPGNGGPSPQEEGSSRGKGPTPREGGNQPGGDR